jgi:hypothetical protein
MIRGLLASLPRGEKAAYRYEGSNRYYRGRVLAALREAPEEGILPARARRRLTRGFRRAGPALAPKRCGEPGKDGLVRVSSTRDRPQTVTEERARYGIPLSR